MIHNDHGENLDFEDIQLEFDREAEKKQHTQSRVSAAQIRVVISQPLNHPAITDTSDLRHPTFEDANDSAFNKMNKPEPIKEAPDENFENAGHSSDH